MKVKFCGADRTVTGSQHLLEVNGKKILLDCGLYQGRREDAYQVNKTFLYEPKELHCVVLSHAHIDHSGNLPNLCAKGFTGDIYATTATRDLCSIMLQDSAHIQVSDTIYANKKRARQNLPPFNPLYTIPDAINVMKLFKAVSYHKTFYIDGLADSVAVTYFDAGHILGSGQVLLEIKENGRTIKFGFTGDVGRPNLPILKDPESMGSVNYIISEATYGGKVHVKAADMDEQLLNVLKPAVARGGKIIVPAFSVGRTQEIVYSLSKLFNSGSLPKFPIFIDSPLSTHVTDVFKMHNECFDDETAKLISQGVDIFGFSNLTYTQNVEESKQLNDFKGLCMIVSASGMCESGRILHHLKNNIENPNNTILIVGYMAENTLGRKIHDAKGVPNSTVRIFGDEYKVNADIEVLDSFSAHADKNELVEYFSHFDKNQLEGIFLVHGEYDQQQMFQNTLSGLNYKNISIPEKGTEIEL